MPGSQYWECNRLKTWERCLLFFNVYYGNGDIMINYECTMEKKIQSRECGFESASGGGEVGRQVRVLNRLGCLREKVRSGQRTAGSRQLAK